MQWQDTDTAKGLTKSAFEALVRAALNDTSNENRINRAQIHVRVHDFIPQHNIAQLVPYIDSALQRLNKSAVRFWPNDEFTLSHDELERLKNRAASIALLNRAFDADVFDLVTDAGENSEKKLEEVAKLAHQIIETYFLQKGEEFAASVARDSDPPVNDEDLKSIVIKMSPSIRLIKGRDNTQFLLHVVTSLMLNPSDATKDYLRLLSDCYTLFAFLEEVPDVQKVTKKLFTHGSIWLDTSALLPLFAEQAFPETMRPFSDLFAQAKAAKVKLFATPGILEEIERHLNLCLTYTRTAGAWEGRVPYVMLRYSLAGRSQGAFSSWLEQFRGEHQPVQDIADYLFDLFGIEVTEPIVANALDSELVASIREYWKKVQDSRRAAGGAFSIAQID
jgi:hypothetical protein